MVTRSYDGPAIDAGWQYFHERPAAEDLDEQAEDVVYATEPEDDGEEHSENVPVPEPDQTPSRPDVDGQSTWDDWGGESA